MSYGVQMQIKAS